MIVYYVILYAPSRALFPQFQSSVPKLYSKALFQSSVPKLRSKAPFQSFIPKLRSKAPSQSYNPTPGGILTPVLQQCRPSKISARHVHLNPQADLLSMSLSPTSRYTYCFRPEFYKLAAGSSPCGLYSLYLDVYGLPVSVSISLST